MAKAPKELAWINALAQHTYSPEKLEEISRLDVASLDALLIFDFDGVVIPD